MTTTNRLYKQPTLIFSNISMKNKKRELALYVTLFIIFCAVIFFTGFMTWFKTWIQKWTFIKESGIQEMRRWHFNRPPLPFMQWRKPILRSKDDVLFFLDWAESNGDLIINMLKDQISIANKRNYSTGKLSKFLEELKEEKTEIWTIKQSILSWGDLTWNFFDKDDAKMGKFKKVMEEIREELNNLQKHINESKETK